MSASRRYEILLPLRLNDGQPVPEPWLGDVLTELEQKFEAVSWETGASRHHRQQKRPDRSAPVPGAAMSVRRPAPKYSSPRLVEHCCARGRAHSGGGVLWETQIIRGAWQREGQSYRDDLMRVFVDVLDTSENRLFFVAFKDRMKHKFQQLEIWLTFYSIEVL